MYRIAFIVIALIAGALAVSGQTNNVAEASQLKLDLMGQTMGGREKCWKFRSLDQIKELTVKSHSEEEQKRTYLVVLQLQAAENATKYEADARITYMKTNQKWKIQCVGLISLKKMQ